MLNIFFSNGVKAKILHADEEKVITTYREESLTIPRKFFDEQSYSIDTDTLVTNIENLFNETFKEQKHDHFLFKCRDYNNESYNRIKFHFAIRYYTHHIDIIKFYYEYLSFVEKVLGECKRSGHDFAEVLHSSDMRVLENVMDERRLTMYNFNFYALDFVIK